MVASLLPDSDLSSFKDEAFTLRTPIRSWRACCLRRPLAVGESERVENLSRLDFGYHVLMGRYR